MELSSILLLIIGITVGFAIGWLFCKNNFSKNNPAKEIEEKNSELNTNLRVAEEKLHLANLEKEKLFVELQEVREKLNAANNRLAKAEEAFKYQQEKLDTQKTEREESQNRLKIEFENIANKLLEEKSKKFTEQNRTNIDTILTPLKEKIKDFEQKVDTAYKTEAAERNSLKGEIKNLVALNKQISDEANNLAKALKGDNKAQGNWGELMLEKILEHSGLIKDQEYETQYSTTNEEGRRLQPDVKINLPENKHILIDAKVSLIAYEAFTNCASDEEKAHHLTNHIVSVKSHIKSLSEKNYPSGKGINAPDFVLMFMPIESSFGIAIQADNELFQFAWERKIVIVSPSTLLATLRTIASVWKQERQSKNAIEIADAAGKMYDKFVSFTEDLEKVNTHIDGAKKSYDSAMNKMKYGTGNLISRAEKIKALGAKTNKTLPPNLLDTDNDA
jgi:DNA recombination protein RmuC